MEKKLYDEYLQILKEELVPAMGCTEPIALAYCAALSRKYLGGMPLEVRVFASANIIKNVKSVVVPNTGGLKGIAAAAAAGIAVGDADGELQVLASVEQEQIPSIKGFMDSTDIQVLQSDKPFILDIQVECSAEGHSALVEIAGFHTNVIKVVVDGESIVDTGYSESTEEKSSRTDHSLLTVEKIVEFADCVEIEDIRETIERQINYNTAIAQEGLNNKWGANIGRILLSSYGDSVQVRAKAWAAAGSDARMNGCDLPVVINSGSGNQGLTASLPVIVYARELHVSQEKLYRALVLSNLITVHLKSGIGKLSAYCGATSAGCGAGAGVTYLYGGGYTQVAHTVVNAVAINSGMICDGAKASCAAKIASAVEAGLLGMQMYMHNSQFKGGDGIIVKGVENTIKNIGTLASVGMAETDRTIIDMMVDKNNLRKCD